MSKNNINDTIKFLEENKITDEDLKCMLKLVPNGYIIDFWMLMEIFEGQWNTT